MHDLNTSLIEAMKAHLPKDDNLAGVIMKVLFLGKEATYRRLRGEVPFTFIEVATISQHLGISIDQIIGNKNQNNNTATFSLNLLKRQFPSESYDAIINSYVNLFEDIIKEKNAELYASSNTIPQTLYLKYESLAKFKFLKWMYQHEASYTYKHYEDVEMDSNVLAKQKVLVQLSHQFPTSTYILDKGFFSRLVKEIKFFFDIGLISTESLQKIKEDISALLCEIEKISAIGKFETGKTANIYISSLNFESNYSYVESPKYHQGMIELFAISSITSNDELFFANLKEWMQSLKKYSTLISQSGEVQRLLFFKKQREIIGSL